MYREISKVERAGVNAAVEQAAEGIVITGRDGTIQYVNPAFTRMTGYTAEEAVGQKPSILKSGRQSEAFYKDLWETILSGRVWFGALINRRKDGTFYTEETQITPVQDAQGEIVSFVAIKRDVSERKEAERKLRETQERFREVFEHAPFGMAVSESDGRFLQVNEALCRMIGYSERELLDKTWRTLTHPDDLEISRGMLQQLGAQAGQSPEVEKRYIHRSGRVAWVRVRLSAIRDSEGCQIGRAHV